MHTIEDRLAALSGLVRVYSGTREVDLACRGGIPLGKRVVIGGAPGAGKTTLVTQWARALAVQGCRVLILATDESADAIAIRLGQHVGCSRDLLEQGDPATISRAQIPPSLTLAEDLSIERAALVLGSDGPRVLVVDSLQTARSDLARSTAKRTQVESVVHALKVVARSGALVIATSELARRAYVGKASPGQGDYKGSGDIEYDADLGIALVTPDRGMTVAATIVKNRLGSKPAWTMHADPARALLLSPGSWQPLVESDFQQEPRGPWTSFFERLIGFGGEPPQPPREGPWYLRAWEELIGFPRV